MTIDRQNQLRNFVSNEVLFLASRLVDDLLTHSFVDQPLGGVALDAIDNFYITDEETAQDYGYESLEAMQDDGADQQEIYEWWFVTEWLYTGLRKKDEPVLNSDYGYLWGRTCTGQAIYMDGVIGEIYDELMAR